MNVSSPRALIVSLLVGIAVSVVGGALLAFFGDKILLYSVGTIMFVVGALCLALGLLGAAEPADGWATQRRSNSRSVAARALSQHPELEDHSSWELAVWALVVGLPLIGLSILCFSLSS